METLVGDLHHIDLAKEFLPCLVGMRAGKIVLDGPPDKLQAGELDELYQLTGNEMMQDA